MHAYLHISLSLSIFACPIDDVDENIECISSKMLNTMSKDVAKLKAKNVLDLIPKNKLTLLINYAMRNVYLAKNYSAGPVSHTQIFPLIVVVFVVILDMHIYIYIYEIDLKIYCRMTTRNLSMKMSWKKFSMELKPAF